MHVCSWINVFLFTGREMLNRLGWDTHYDPVQMVSIAIPRDVKRLFMVIGFF
jgi:hypothetical protein